MATAKKKGKKPKANKTAKPKTKQLQPHQYFFLIDGSTLDDLYALAKSFDSMSADVFHYHVTEFKNDFAAWIRDVLEEEDLAKELEFARNISESHIAVLKHIVKKLKK